MFAKIDLPVHSLVEVIRGLLVCWCLAKHFSQVLELRYVVTKLNTSDPLVVRAIGRTDFKSVDADNLDYTGL